MSDLPKCRDCYAISAHDGDIVCHFVQRSVHPNDRCHMTEAQALQAEAWFANIAHAIAEKEAKPGDA